MNGQRGVTLMELMVTVAIIVILATLALPSYSNYRLKTNRPIGSECLVEAQRRIENAYAHLGRYPGTDLSSYGYASASVSCGDQALYSIGLAFPNSTNCPQASCYQLTASAQGSQLKDGNLRLTYDATGMNYNSTQTSPSARLVREHLPPAATTWLASWDFQPGQ